MMDAQSRDHQNSKLDMSILGFQYLLLRRTFSCVLSFDF